MKKGFKNSILFCLGGTAYVIVELCWRGRSDGSMFLLGGMCFMIVGGKIAAVTQLPLALRLVAGATVITALELLTGLVVNRDYRVWDYRTMPLQFLGQICLSYSLLWIPVSLGAMHLYDWADRFLDRISNSKPPR